MSEFESYYVYNADLEHDMVVDFSYHVNTGELPEVCDEDFYDELMESLDDWD